MKRLLIVMGLFAGAPLAAQSGFYAGASARYMMADAWDEIVRTYNFSRPFAEEKMGLFSYGWQAEAGYLHRYRIHWAFPFSAGFHQTTSQAYSSAAFTGGSEYQLRATINAATLDAGVRYYFFSPDHKEKVAGMHKHIYVELSPGFALLMPRVRLNGELTEEADEDVYRPFLPAFRLTAGVGTEKALNTKWWLCPFFRTEFFPAANLDGFAGMINGSYLPDLDDKSRVFAFQLGIQLKRAK
ncbi:MAG: hypothetical protein IM638_11970 [Bacteroidetes bacterium]|nr:hypothetical protein [Bacteroidota bacterium]